MHTSATILAAALAGASILGASIDSAHAEGLVAALVQRFSESQFQAIRGKTNAPFLPGAWITLTSYQDMQLTNADGAPTGVSYRELSLSQGTFLPLPIGHHDLLLVGEWLEKTRFRPKESGHGDIDIISVSVPVGWARQLGHDWQLAAFVAPLGHRNPQDGWYWETLGGAFGRWFRNDNSAWIFGVYFDVSGFSDFYTPYVGGTFILSDRWTISAVLPWPGVIYAPNSNFFLRLGLSPSQTSWSVEEGTHHPRISLGALNLGLRAERRVFDNIWFGVEGGVSGIRGLTVTNAGWQPLRTQLSGTLYGLLTIEFRPSVN